MPNTWVSFVKEFASKKKMKYNEALKSADCKAEYQSNKPKSSDDMKREMNNIIEKTPKTPKTPRTPKIPKIPKSQMKMDMIEPPSKPVEMPIKMTEIKAMVNRVSKLKPKKDQAEMK